MAEKKQAKRTTAKQTKPKQASESIIDNPDLLVMSPDYECVLLHIEPELQEELNKVDLTASDLAAMARAAKAGKADMQDVIKVHEAYLKAIAQGAIAPAADVDFVKNHMKHLKTL